MLFVAVCIDKAGALDTRLSIRPAHVAWLESLGKTLRLAGPFLEADKPVGSMLIVEAEDDEAASTLLAEDPYSKAGIFDSVEIRPWRHTFGTLG